MELHKVVSHDEWIAARKELLAREKELTHARDEIAAAARCRGESRKTLRLRRPERKRDPRPISLRQAASSSSITSCRPRLGRRAAPVAPVLPTISTAPTIHLRIAIYLRRRLARPVGENRDLQKAHGLELPLGVVLRHRFNCDFTSRPRRRKSRRQSHLQL